MVSFKNVPEMFLHRVKSTPGALAFQYPSGTGWSQLSWTQTLERVRQLASGLRALGLQPEERCAILSATRIEWILADLATLCARGATTTIYPSSTAEDCAYILQDSGTRIVFADTEEQLTKLRSHRQTLPDVRHVVTFDGKASEDGWILRYETLLEKGRAYDAAHPEAFEREIGLIGKDALATLIYTSGTTGRPKGVELTQDNWLFVSEGIEALQVFGPEDSQYLWLPLAHVFGKVLEVMQLRLGFPTAVDGRVDKLVENLAVIRPTFVCAVPRIFEKVHNRVVAQAREAGGLKEKIFNWAFRVGREVSTLRQEGREPSGLLAIQHAVADKLVFSKIRARFGGRLRFFISGGAPLARDIALFFHAAGILIAEGYGLTETSAASFVNRPQSIKFGTVGLAVQGTQIRIAPEDGEILLKGRGVMRGYHNMAEGTREVFTTDGWFRTGDIGELDAQGFLRITDRKKDLIKTSNGKYVAPQAVEGKLKATCPFVSQVVVHGDNRAFCTALVALEEESIKKWAKENGLGDLSYPQLAAHERVHGLIKGYMDQLNAGLASHETVKKFALLPADLSEATGEMTASLKVKRKVVEQKYRHLLDGLYGGAGDRAA